MMDIDTGHAYIHASIHAKADTYTKAYAYVHSSA